MSALRFPSLLPLIIPSLRQLVCIIHKRGSTTSLVPWFPPVSQPSAQFGGWSKSPADEVLWSVFARRERGRWSGGGRR